MKRDDADVFRPPAFRPGLNDLPGALPDPGPTPGWTAAAVIRTLEPLALPARTERLRAVLSERIDSVTVALDNPHDPHNGSAVLRSCDAFGVQTLHVLSQHEPFLASRSISQGSHHWVDVVSHHSPTDLVETLRASRHSIVVTHPQGRLTLADLPRLPRVALVLGNEHAGVSPEIAALADDTLRIPMRGFVESLNLSVSAALVLEAATRGRAGDLSEAARENVYARWLQSTVPRADEVLLALKPSPG